MKQIELFIKRFTGKDILKGFDIFTVENKHFLVTKKIRELLDHYERKLRMNPFYAGLYLGKSRGDKFFPSINLLNMISEVSRRKVSVNRKQEWLFACGRDLLESRRREKFKIGDQVLVMNEYGECIGFGRISERRKVFVENVMDIGDFLRRER